MFAYRANGVLPLYSYKTIYSYTYKIVFMVSLALNVVLLKSASEVFRFEVYYWTFW